MESVRCGAAPREGDGGCAWCGEVLPPRRRRYCSEGCSEAWRANHYWPAARAAALLRDDYRCVVCHDPEDVEVHHKVPVGRRGYSSGCHHHLELLEVLCPPHHAEADAARRRAESGRPMQLSLLAA